MTMLAKLFGIVLLLIGAVLAVAVLMFALKVAAAVALLYLGYRLLTRHRRRTY